MIVNQHIEANLWMRQELMKFPPGGLVTVERIVHNPEHSPGGLIDGLISSRLRCGDFHSTKCDLHQYWALTFFRIGLGYGSSMAERVGLNKTLPIRNRLSN